MSTDKSRNTEPDAQDATRNRPAGTIPEGLRAAVEHATEEVDARARDKARVLELAYQRGFRDGEAKGFRDGAGIGRLAGEGDLLDQLAPVIGTEPSPYDAAIEALHAAVQLVEPVESAKLLLDEEFGPTALAYARLTTGIADALVTWLSEHVEPETEHTDTRAVDIVGSGDCSDCGGKFWRHRAGCAGDPDDPAAASGPSGISDFAPLLVNAGPWQVEITPPPLRAEPCPECRSGKHDNCPGRVLDPLDQWAPCPCAGDTHPESLG